LTPLLQSLARDLTSAGKEIEQLQASQEQLTRGAARLSEQLKVSREQVARDNANVAEQIRAIQDQLARINEQAAEHNASAEIATAPIRSTHPRPRPTVLAARKPVPTLSSPLTTAKPKAEKPKLSSASGPPAPAR
jgi:septal ring factor EnvC (AmiA/AmiB activator)